MMPKNLLHLAAAGLVLALASGPASALSLSIGRSTAGSTQSVPDNVGSNPHKDADWSSSALDPGGTAADLVGNSVDGAVRYTAVVAGDDEIVLGDTGDIAADLVFTTTITITAPASVQYDLRLDTSWLGAFVVNTDDGSQADMVLSNALASVSGCSPPALCNEVNQLTLSGQTLNNVSTDTHDPFSDSGTYTIFGLSGSQTITLVYDINTMSVVPEKQDVAILLGEQSDTCSADPSAGCYPGIYGRLQANDGLFVTATATLTAVPEPGTALLLGSGLLGLVVAGRRRRE